MLSCKHAPSFSWFSTPAFAIFEDTTISCCLVVVLIAPTSKFKKILLIQNGDKLFQLWFENSKTAKMLTGKAVPAKVFTSTVGGKILFTCHCQLVCFVLTLNSKALDVPSILNIYVSRPKVINWMRPLHEMFNNTPRTVMQVIWNTCIIRFKVKTCTK